MGGRRSKMPLTRGLSRQLSDDLRGSSSTTAPSNELRGSSSTTGLSRQLTGSLATSAPRQRELEMQPRHRRLPQGHSTETLASRQWRRGESKVRPQHARPQRFGSSVRRPPRSRKAIGQAMTKDLARVKSERNVQPTPMPTIAKPTPKPIIAQPNPEPIIAQPTPKPIIAQPTPKPIIAQPTPKPASPRSPISAATLMRVSSSSAPPKSPIGQPVPVRKAAGIALMRKKTRQAEEAVKELWTTPQIFECLIPDPGVGYRLSADFADKDPNDSNRGPRCTLEDGTPHPKCVIGTEFVKSKEGVTFLKCCTGRGWLPLHTPDGARVLFKHLGAEGEVDTSKLLGHGALTRKRFGVVSSEPSSPPKNPIGQPVPVRKAAANALMRKKTRQAEEAVKELWTTPQIFECLIPD